MDNLTNRLWCPLCGARFFVELQKMRANMPSSCPSCGFQCGITEVQAISAHRLLERLEYRESMVIPIPRFGASVS